MFKIHDLDFDIKTFSGNLVISDGKISISGVDLAFKQDGIRPYWKSIPNNYSGIFNLSESTIKEINQQGVIKEESLVKKACLADIRKNIKEKIEIPLLRYVSEQISEIKDISIVNYKLAEERAEKVKTELFLYYKNPEISPETKEALDKHIRGFFDRIEPGIVLYKKCGLMILNAIKEYNEVYALSDEQKRLFDVFLTQLKNSLKIKFFVDNLSNLDLGSFSKERAVESVISLTKRGIEDDLIYIFSGK